MMYNYPFFSFPRSRRYGIYEPSASYSNVSMPYSNISTNKVTLGNSNTFNKNYSNHYNTNMENKNTLQEKFKHSKLPFSSPDLKKSASNPQRRKHEDEAEPLFEIFGLQLYYDDILLICLIFFLYQEGVQDEYLFIALILLLLS